MADAINYPFNTQVMIATSGAANAGIDNKEVHIVLCFEYPPSIEYCIQEEGRDGRRFGDDYRTDWYCICISLESFIAVLRRLLLSKSATEKYRVTLISDFHVTPSVLVLPAHCIWSLFAYKAANPFYLVQPPL